MESFMELALNFQSAWHCILLKIHFACQKSPWLCGRFAFISIYPEYSRRWYGTYCGEATSTRNVPQQVPEKRMQSITIKVTRKGILSIHSMAGWLIQTNKILCKWQMIIIVTCIFDKFLNKSNRKMKLALKVIHIQLLVAMSICTSSINIMKETRPPKLKLWDVLEIFPSWMANLIQKIQEQLHLKLDNDKKFLNTMQQTTHIYLFLISYLSP